MFVRYVCGSNFYMGELRGCGLDFHPRTRALLVSRGTRASRAGDARAGRRCHSMLDCAAARAAVLQDANLLAEVLAFLPLPRTVLLTREVARLWRETAKRPLLRVALHDVLALKRARLQSDACVTFRTSGADRTTLSPDELAADEHPTVKWLVHSYENGICSAVFDALGGYRKSVVDAIVWFLGQGLTRLLIVAQPSALRDWARMLQAAGVSCIDQVTAGEEPELYTRLHRDDPRQRMPAVLLRTPSQVEDEVFRAERDFRAAEGRGPTAPGIFGAGYWHYAVFDVAPMVHLHETQLVALSDRLKLQQRLRCRHLNVLPNQGHLTYVLLSASPPPTQLHKLAPLLQLCPWPAPEVAMKIYSRMLEVVDRFCMGDAETRRWALKDYLPSEVAYLLRPCLLHVHT